MISKLLLVCLSLSLMGCSGFGKKLKSWISDDKPKTMSAKAVGGPQQKGAMSFNQQPFMNPGPKRQYKRTQKKDIENESRLDDRTNSLWVMEGQGAYLFSQNIVRMIGDALLVKIEGEPKSQLDSKAKVIEDLVKKIEERKKAQARRLAGKSSKTEKEPAKPPAQPGAENGEDTSPFTVKTVPTRIVERLVDGNYRIKGSQPFMIGKYQYKVNVTGIVRSEDFNEEGVSATKLLDPNFDIVSARKSMAGL